MYHLGILKCEVSLEGLFKSKASLKELLKVPLNQESKCKVWRLGLEILV